MPAGFWLSIAILGLASQSGGLSAQELAQIEKILLNRLADTNTKKFGINRLGEPYLSHGSALRVMRPETPEEAALAESLRAKGWNAVVYTIGARNSRRPNGSGMVVNGPAFLAGVDKNLPTVGDADAFIDKVRSMREAKDPRFVYRGWHFQKRDVRALAACTSCHRGADGKPVRIGDVIGHLAIGLKKVP